MKITAEVFEELIKSVHKKYKELCILHSKGIPGTKEKYYGFGRGEDEPYSLKKSIEKETGISGLNGKNIYEREIQIKNLKHIEIEQLYVNTFCKYVFLNSIDIYHFLEKCSKIDDNEKKEQYNLLDFEVERKDIFTQGICLDGFYTVYHYRSDDKMARYFARIYKEDDYYMGEYLTSTRLYTSLPFKYDGPFLTIKMHTKHIQLPIHLHIGWGTGCEVLRGLYTFYDPGEAHLASGILILIKTLKKTNDITTLYDEIDFITSENEISVENTTELIVWKYFKSLNQKSLKLEGFVNTLQKLKELSV